MPVSAPSSAPAFAVSGLGGLFSSEFASAFVNVCAYALAVRLRGPAFALRERMTHRRVV